MANLSHVHRPGMLSQAARDAEPEEESQEPEPRDKLPESDADAHGDGDGEKTEKVGTVWTPEQDEQIAAFFEDNVVLRYGQF